MVVYSVYSSSGSLCLSSVSGTGRTYSIWVLSKTIETGSSLFVLVTECPRVPGISSRPDWCVYLFISTSLPFVERVPLSDHRLGPYLVPENQG